MLFGGEIWLDCCLLAGAAVAFMAYSLGVAKGETRSIERKALEEAASDSKTRGRPASRFADAGASFQPSRRPSSAETCSTASSCPVDCLSSQVKDPGAVTCRFYIGIKAESDFKVVRRIIGKGGKNMKAIVEQYPDARIRLRGRGSGFLEGSGKVEADVPLMMCIRASTPENFRAVLKRVEDLMNWVYGDYRAFHRYSGLPEPEFLGCVMCN